MANEKHMEFALKTRQSFKEYDDVRDSGLTVPDELACFYDIAYNQYEKLDIYYPKAADKPQMTIVSIHGGAYVYGDKERYRYYCADLAARGFTVVNFSYRLAPEHHYPAQLEDINDVFRWIERNAGEYLIDLDNIFVLGDSAGAQLAHQYITMLTNNSYGSLFDINLPRITVRACALNCGMYDMKTEVFVNDPTPIYDCYFGGKAADFAEQLDVLGHMTADFPPIYVMTAYYDFLRDAAKPLVEALKRNGMDYRYRLYGAEGDVHMSHVFHLNIRLPEAMECNNDECEFFREKRSLHG